MPVGIARIKIIPKLPEFIRAHPKLTIELSCTDRRVDLIREGFDCVIRVGTLADSNLIARPLGTLKLINCASPAYIHQYSKPATIDELVAHRMIHYSPSFTVPSSTFDYVLDGQSYQKNVANSIAVNNADAYQAACLAGLGIIQAPEFGVRELIAQGDLVELLPEYNAAPMPVSLLYANRRHLPKRTQLLMNWVAEVMQD
jgi:DNA-binding transcriptional LysR family regulator